MIKVKNWHTEYEVIVEQEKFADGSLKIKELKWHKLCNFDGYPTIITWLYDNDAELFALCCVMDYLKTHAPNNEYYLELPYIPNARQDRMVSSRLFTLKTFAKIINSLNFSKVQVWDAHSDVSLALIDRVVNLRGIPFGLPETNDKKVAVMYPDAGAAKKYSAMYPGIKNFIIGTKYRDENGLIINYELTNFHEGIEEVWIRDDICGYGNTFVHAAKALRELGVKKIYLVVTHCENNILKGEVLDYVDRVYTTDSIYTGNHPKIMVVGRERMVRENVQD